METKVRPSRPATGQRTLSGSNRMKLPSRTGTLTPNRTAPPGPAPSISSTLTTEYPMGGHGSARGGHQLTAAVERGSCAESGSADDLQSSPYDHCVDAEELIQVAERQLADAEAAYRLDPSEANQRKIMKAWSVVRRARGEDEDDPQLTSLLRRQSSSDAD